MVDNIDTIKKHRLDRILPRPQRQREVAQRPKIGVEHQSRATIQANGHEYPSRWSRSRAGNSTRLLPLDNGSALRRQDYRKNFRCLAGRYRLFSVIIVEAAARLAAEPAGLDIFDEQGTAPVFAVGKTLVEHLHDGQAGIEPDKVGEFEGAHRVVRAEL